MALSSEDRSAFHDYARNLRADPALIAVAEHLAACEALLGEIALLPDSRAGHIASHPEQTLAEYIRALLGPAATEEGG